VGLESRKLSLDNVRFSRPVIAMIATVLLIGAAASPSVADNVGPARAVALPFGDIILPLPTMPPSNADPMNPASPGDVLTQRYNNLRTGTTLFGGLDQRSFSDQRFGLLGRLEVDGAVVAQPLFMANVVIKEKRRSAVFIATSANLVYAFDADTREELWRQPLGEPYTIDRTVNGEHCLGQMEQTRGKPSEGIQSTPVIDVASSRIIVVYRKQDPIPGGKLHIAALNLLNGHPDLDLPVENDSLWNQVHRNRASLLLDDGRVYVAFAGRCEAPGFSSWPPAGSEGDGALEHTNFQGWIYAFDAVTLTLRARYRTTQQPSATPPLKPPTEDRVAGGGIWQASTGLAADEHGSLYFSTGNQASGVFATTQQPDPSGKNLPDSIVRLRIDASPGGISMTAMGWFTPYRKGWLDKEDLDLGSAGVVLIPNTRYMVAAGKEGMLYVLDRDNLGKFDDSAPTPEPRLTSLDELGPDDARRDRVVQKFRIGENKYCADTQPNAVFCLGPRKGYPPDASIHLGVDAHQWFPWPHVHATPLFGAFPDGRAFLYVWPEKDSLKSYQWWGRRFETLPTKAKNGRGDVLLAPPYIGNVPGTIGDAIALGMPGGFLSLTIDPAQPAAGVLFASVQRCRLAKKDPAFQVNRDDPGFNECSLQQCQMLTPDSWGCGQQTFGMLRAFDPITLRELWNNQTDPTLAEEDKNYMFAKFVPPTIAHGRVFLATASRGVLVYGRR
jgi:hypothetical protein